MRHQPFEGRAQKNWYQIDEYDSQEPRCVKQNPRDDKGPSLGIIHVKASHQRSLYAVKFEDRSQEETERHERCARGHAWRLGKNNYKLQEKGQSYILFTYRCVNYAGRIHNETGG